jgi:hypothetical protein
MARRLISPRALTRVAFVWLLSLGAAAWGQGQRPAEISIRRVDGEPLTTIELGERIELEVAIDAGSAEISGFTFYLSYDSDVFRLLEPSGIRTVDTVAEPFAPGGWLDGVVLLNRVEEEEGITYLAYAEAAGVQRGTATRSGVAATFILEALRRPLGDVTTMTIEERGHDRVTHYTTRAQPGTELLFGHPLETASLRVTGFRIQSLPDVQVVEGDGAQVVFQDLDDFLDQEGASVIWDPTFVEGLNTVIDVDGMVMMTPEGVFGDTTVVFTAFEVNEGNADADTVKVRILARPQIIGLPSTVAFVEDGASAPIELDDFVTDLDSPADELQWTPTNGNFIHVDIDPTTRVAQFSADPDSFGEADIRLVVSDSTGLTDSVTVRVIVTAVNDPPFVERREPVYPRLGEGGSIIIPLSALITDADDRPDSLQILLQTEGGVMAQLTPDGQSLELTGTSTGRGLVHITAQDRGGEVSTGRIVAVVLPEGTTLAPQLAPLPLLRFTKGTFGTLDLNTLVDDDNPVDQLSWAAASVRQLKPIVSDGVLLVTAEAGFTGFSAVGLIVTDSDGNQDRASLAVEVVLPGEPQPPQLVAPVKIGLISSSTDGRSPTEVTLNLDAIVADPDDDDVDIVWTVTASTGLLAEYDPSTRQVRLSATQGMNEVAALTLTATDPGGLSSTESIPVLVVQAGGAPLIDTLQDVALDSAADEGRVDLDDVVFDDEDFESELEWIAEGEPGIIVELDPVTHLLRIRRDEMSTQPASEARVVLTARDSGDQGTSVILTVSLPPVFQLDPIRELVLYAGSTDTTLVLDEYVVGSAPTLLWTVEPTTQLEVTIDEETTRVRVTSSNSGFIGTEIVSFLATDDTGRQRAAPVDVRVQGRGLAPQVRTLSMMSVRAGEEDRSLDLDDFVVDDDPDSTLIWSVSQPSDVIVSIDPLNHELSVRPDSTAAGPRTAQLLVRDPAGNTALGILQIQVLRGGEPPVVTPLPQILLPAGGPEQALSLDLYVEDADTPDNEIDWTVIAEPGVAARIEARRLFVSIPAGQQGSREVALSAEDPQGNRDEGRLIILIQQDDELPRFALEAKQNAVVGDLLDIIIQPSEELTGPPQVTINGVAVEVRDRGDGTYEASYAIPPVDMEQTVAVIVTGRDRAGNLGKRSIDITAKRLSGSGGSVAIEDGQATVNVPSAIVGPGRLAVFYPLSEEDRPDGIGDDPGTLIFLAVNGENDLMAPVTLNLFAGVQVGDQNTGVEHWKPVTQLWEDVPTVVDEDTGWLSASVTKPGIYRIGQVEPGNRRPASQLNNYPNPFNPIEGDTSIEYEVTQSGGVVLEVYNLLGQRVRLLVDEGFQAAGLWTTTWDGRDDDGLILASGIYIYRLREPGAKRVRQMLLLK